MTRQIGAACRAPEPRVALAAPPSGPVRRVALAHAAFALVAVVLVAAALRGSAHCVSRLPGSPMNQGHGGGLAESLVLAATAGVNGLIPASTRISG